MVIDSPVANQIFSGSLVKDKSNTDAAPGACAGVAPADGLFVVLFADDGAEGLGGIGVVDDVRGGGVDVEADAPDDDGVVEGEDSPPPCTSTNC